MSKKQWSHNESLLVRSWKERYSETTVPMSVSPPSVYGTHPEHGAPRMSRSFRWRRVDTESECRIALGCKGKDSRQRESLRSACCRDRTALLDPVRGNISPRFREARSLVTEGVRHTIVTV